MVVRRVDSLEVEIHLVLYHSKKDSQLVGVILNGPWLLTSEFWAHNLSNAKHLAFFDPLMKRPPV